MGESSEVLYEIVCRSQRYTQCFKRPWGSLACKKQKDFLVGDGLEGCEGCSRLVGFMEMHLLE